jgi:hypothetical protein
MRRIVTEKRCFVYCIFPILDVSFVHDYSSIRCRPAGQFPRGHRQMAHDTRFCQGCRMLTDAGAAMAASGLCPGPLLAADRGRRGAARHRFGRRQPAGATGGETACTGEWRTSVTRQPQIGRVRRREKSGVSRMIGRWPEGIRFEDAIVPAEGFFKGTDREIAGVWPESSLATVGRIAGRR